MSIWNYAMSKGQNAPIGHRRRRNRKSQSLRAAYNRIKDKGKISVSFAEIRRLTRPETPACGFVNRSICTPRSPDNSPGIQSIQPKIRPFRALGMARAQQLKQTAA